MARRLRKHRRVSIDIWNGPGEPRLRDISISGLRAQSKVPLHIDQRIEVDLPAPGRMLKLRGRIVRARLTGLKDHPYEYGVELDALAPDEHDLVLRFIAERGQGEEPVTQVDGAELETLTSRVQELEQELAQLRFDTVEIEPPAEVHPVKSARVEAKNLKTQEVPQVKEDDLRTNFDRGRFSRLLALGQPLMPLVDEPATELGDKLHQLVARTFSECFDFATLKQKLPGSLTNETIVGALFVCYERHLIDFA